jgi:hypothetical protein
MTARRTEVLISLDSHAIISRYPGSGRNRNNGDRAAKAPARDEGLAFKTQGLFPKPPDPGNKYATLGSVPTQLDTRMSIITGSTYVPTYEAPR